MTRLDVPQVTSFTRFVRRWPILTFLLIGLPAAGAAMGVAALAQYEVMPGRDLPAQLGLDMEEAASVALVAVIFATAVFVTRAVEGPEGVRILVRRMTRWQVSPIWWLTAVAAMPLGTVLLAVLLGDHLSTPSPATVAGELVSIAVALLVANIWEEGTWLGFMQTRLERRHGFFAAAALTAVPFAAVHLPLRVINGSATTPAELISAFAILVVFCFFVRTLLGTVARGASNSVLLAAATHTMFNRSNNGGGLGDDLLAGPNRQLAALMAAVLLTVVLVVVNRRRLSRSYRRELDALEQESVTTPEPATTDRSPT
jgi:membrane protease YdiL (CAAX protease family)